VSSPSSAAGDVNARALAAFPIISVIIPCRNEEAAIGGVIDRVKAQTPSGSELEVIVVDDASTDRTIAVAEAAGARVLALPARPGGGNPAAARNRGAAISRGDPIIFLDSDCTPHEGWLQALLAEHAKGYEVVGGSLGLPDGLSFSARCDYYCGWYHVHPRRRAASVLHHPPCNLSVRRDVFRATKGYVEQQPIAYAHEELEWQADVLAKGGRIFFQPQAVVDHHNRPGFGNLLRRNYRWGYSALPSKISTGTARFAFLYEHPRLLVLASFPLALASTAYILGCWIKARMFEPVLMAPAMLLARLAYSAGMAAGGLFWLRKPEERAFEHRPRWE
jgi:glycosyltransferase involved in cell wall biosynthesis